MRGEGLGFGGFNCFHSNPTAVIRVPPMSWSSDRTPQRPAQLRCFALPSAVGIQEVFGAYGVLGSKECRGKSLELREYRV